MNRLRAIQTRAQQGHALSAACRDTTTPPPSPPSGSPLTAALRGLNSLLKCTILSAVLTVLVIVLATSHIHTHSRMASISVFSSGSMLRPARIIKTHKLFTMHTETVQDTVVQRIESSQDSTTHVIQHDREQQQQGQEGAAQGSEGERQLPAGEPTVEQMQQLAKQMAEQQLPIQKGGGQGGQKQEQQVAAAQQQQAVTQQQQQAVTQQQQQQQLPHQQAVAQQEGATAAQQPKATELAAVQQQQQQQPTPQQTTPQPDPATPTPITTTATATTPTTSQPTQASATPTTATHTTAQPTPGTQQPTPATLTTPQPNPTTATTTANPQSTPATTTANPQPTPATTTTNAQPTPATTTTTTNPQSTPTTQQSTPTTPQPTPATPTTAMPTTPQPTPAAPITATPATPQPTPATPTTATPTTPQQLEEAVRKAPPDFQWRTYLSFYPDLIAAGVTSEALAKHHYTTMGMQERRLYRPLNITLRYTACGGLMNQHYSHIAAISLAASLNASVALPAALSRNSFNSYFSQDPSKNQVFWTAAPASSMWDVQHLQSYWAERGIRVFEAPHDVALPDLARPGTAYPTYLPPGFTWAQVARLHNIYLKPVTLNRLLKEAREQLLAVAAQQPDPYGPLLLDAPCTLFSLHTKSARRLVQQVTRSLQFAPHLHALADRITSRLNLTATPPGTPPPFNGLHLRLEGDAADWARILGGREKLLQMYVDACQAAGFDSQTPVYLASGLFTYGSQTDAAKLEIIHKLAQVSSRLMYKEQYLGPEEVGGLSKEQHALVDFLVLAKARSFVGISVSTFSYYLREYRALQGINKASTVLVNGKRVGTDPLFEKAGRIV